MCCLKKLTQKSPHFVSFRAWFIRATSCTLRGNPESRIGVDYSCNKLHATRESWITYRGWIIRATRESWIAYRGWIIRATSCTLHSKWITFVTVDNILFEKTHAKITALYFVPCVVHSCNKLHATRESWITYRGWIIRVTSYTLRGVKDARYGASYNALPLRIKKARHFHVVLFC